MDKLIVFENEDFGKVRTTEFNRQPYICLVDVCKILELE